jgi:hypothetical protein
MSAMTADDVCAFLALMEKHRIDVWLDGGWAADRNCRRPRSEVHHARVVGPLPYRLRARRDRLVGCVSLVRAVRHPDSRRVREIPERLWPAMTTDARLWHPWLRINRVLRVMLHTRWSTEAWSVVRVEFRRALAQRSEIRRAGWFN